MITYRVTTGHCMACDFRGPKLVHLSFGPQGGPKLAEVTLCGQCLQDLRIAAGDHLARQVPASR